MGAMEKKMETTSLGLKGLGFKGLGAWDYRGFFLARVRAILGLYRESMWVI